LPRIDSHLTELIISKVMQLTYSNSVPNYQFIAKIPVG
jgi:hypothetical protein